MSASQAKQIVVGVDGKPASGAALTFALREGLRRGSPVKIVTAWVFGGPYDGSLGRGSVEQARENAESAQSDALNSALVEVDELPILSQTVVEGPAGPALVRAAEGAAYLVVGAPRKRFAERARPGSVSGYCVRHASIPVLVIPSPATTRVGV